MAEDEKKLGDYLLLEKIAQGGMAQVFKAKTVDPNGIERLVVIKRILPHIASDPEYVNMLIDEAKIAVHFNHGNIAQIYDLGRVGEDYFMAMEYVDGKTIGQILRDFKDRGIPIPIDLIVYCISELCHGLDYMHRKSDADGKALGVVHRDISPQNIIVSYSGTVKIIDFGVAKSIGKLSQTESGVLKGKFAYMSPEQAEGDEIDLRSDIFSCGILLWELLTQERLFKKATNKDTLKAVRAAHFIPPSKIRNDIPAELDRILEKALKKKKDKRYQSAAEMGNDLTQFLSKNYPDFRRVQVAEFLYRYFGPEADEKGLPPELPELAITQEPKLAKQKQELEEEKTEIDHLGNFRLKFSAWKNAFINHLKNQKLFLTAVIVFTIILPLMLMVSIKVYKHLTHGILILEVFPCDSRVEIEGKLIEAKLCDHQVELTPEIFVNVKATYTGYLPYENHFKVAKGERYLTVINLQKEIPPFGDLILNTNPPGATIYVNDVEWNQKTPTTVTHLASTTNIKIGVYLDGYQFLEQQVSLNKGEKKNLALTLVGNTTELEIDTDPPGAAVTLEDQLVGATPYVNHRLDPGKPIHFTVSLPGYEPLNQTVTLDPGEKKKLLLELKVREN